jgi:hypothetical protein
VLTEPVGELPSVDAASRQIEHDALLLIKAGVNLSAVQHEECLHRSMAGALVAVHGEVVSYEREAEGCRLLGQRGIDIAAGQRDDPGLSEGRFQRTQIPDPCSAAGRVEKSPIQVNDFRRARYRTRRGADTAPGSS